MSKLCNIELCTGCMACYNACGKHAIKIQTNKYGFNYPSIDESKCIDCGLCTKACPILFPRPQNSLLETYGAWSKDSAIQQNSSSGGFFTIVATWILSKGGIVIGAAFDSHFNVNHVAIDNINELYKLRGSKYIQSNINSAYKETRKYLDEQRYVLFTGTPCQIAGLKSFLRNKEYTNLYTLDLVCHGVPSNLIFQSYKNWLEKKYNSNIINFKFRDKKWSWAKYNIKATFKNGEVYYGKWEEDVFMRGFLREYFLRDSCHHCHYTNLNRPGDITIADFWGYKKGKKEKNNKDEGISLLIINTPKGKTMFENCKSHLIYYKKDIQIAVNGNKCLSNCFPVSPLKEDFWQTFYNQGFEATIERYLYPEPINNITGLLYKYGKGNIFYMIAKQSIRYRIVLGAMKLKIFSFIKYSHTR